MTRARENGSGKPQPEAATPGSERIDATNTSSDSDHDDDKSAGVPRWLKIAAVAIPVFATICAGLWTVSSVLMGQYVELQKSLEQERTKQAASRTTEADSTKQAANARLEAEKEVTRRQELQHTAEANTRRDEIQLQRLRTDEQQARQTVSTNEINRQIAADKTTAQIQDDGAFASLIAAVSSNVEKPDTPPSTVSLAALMRYANNSRYAEILAAALVARSARIATLEEAQLCLRLAQAIQPVDFALITKLNRLARRKVEERAIQDFWRQYAPQVEKQSPHGFLEQLALTHVYETHSLAYAGIEREIYETFSGLRLSPDVVRSALETKKSQKPLDPSVVEANTFLMEHSADMMMQYILASTGKGVKLDVSGCYLPYTPVHLDIQLVTDKTFFEQLGAKNTQ